MHFLETSEDHGILDPDDMLCDVVDDKDKVLSTAFFPCFVSILVLFLVITSRLNSKLLFKIPNVSCFC